MRSLLATFALLAVLAVPVHAQVTRADSAEALLRAARVLEAQGRTRLARELFQHVAQRYPETSQAGVARETIAQLPGEAISGLGRTGFLTWNTLYGAFLGIAIPAAFGADDPEPFGVGLLLGAPLGFFASRAYARGHGLTDGQAGVVSFGSFWGTWQGLGWREVFEIGDGERCDQFGCFPQDSDAAPWAAAVIGGLTGLGVGVLAARAAVPAGTSTLVFNASMWGTWYALAAGIIADAEEDELLTTALIGGNVGVLAAIPAARAWQPSPARVRTVSALGLAGGLAGLGASLLASVDDSKAAAGIISAGVTAGLVTGIVLTRGPNLGDGETGEPAPALLFRRDGWRLGLPLPVPTMLPESEARRRQRWIPGARLLLLDARF